MLETLAARVIAGAIGLAVLGGGAGVVVWKIRHDATKEQKVFTKAAENQAAVNDVATQAVDHYHTETVVIRERADRAVQAVQQAEGADAPLPPAVRDAWLAGLSDAPAASPSDPRPGKPSH